ncbi:MAG: phosphatase PAP2 family protein [Chloroflexota bacterium]
MVGVDERVFLWLNGLAGRWPWLDRVMAFLVNDYFVLLCLSLLLVVLWFIGGTAEGRAHLQTTVLTTAAGIGFAVLAVMILNELFYRPRPFTYLPAKLLFYRPHDSSLPSNSAAAAFAAAAGIWLGNRKVGLFALILASLYAFSRVYAGVHFPLDVIAGAAIGFACGYLAFWLFRTLRWVPQAAIWLMRKLRLA